MRTLLLALMIVLLPVRGWVGDAMAGQMLAQQLAATQSVAQEHHSARTGGPSGSETAVNDALPCPDHAAPSGTARAEPHHPPGKSCAGCASCDVCHTVALAPTVFLPPTAAPPGAAPHTTAWRPASAEATRHDKPPIG